MAKKSNPPDRRPLRPKGVPRWEPMTALPGSMAKVWTPTPPHPYWDQKYRDAASWSKQTLGLSYEDGKGGLVIDHWKIEGSEEPPPELKSVAEAILDQWSLVEQSYHQGQVDNRAISELDKLIVRAQQKINRDTSKIPGGRKRAEHRWAAQPEKWAKWQAAAEKVWAKHPTWSKSSVARNIAKQFPSDNVDTIRKKIQEPTW